MSLDVVLLITGLVTTISYRCSHVLHVISNRTGSQVLYPRTSRLNTSWTSRWWNKRWRILGDPGAAENKTREIGARESLLDWQESSPAHQVNFRPFYFSPSPIICPWVSKDGNDGKGQEIGLRKLFPKFNVLFYSFGPVKRTFYLSSRSKSHLLYIPDSR